jgi:hypothetical protein
LLALGENGAKGERWFNMMIACLELPTEGVDEFDPFYRTRVWWEQLRCAFYGAIYASWLILIDESMILWLGRGMPGLMVVPRKPTPVGTEVHTACCAMSGIMVWLEVYEGKQAMREKKYVELYPASIALTLRMTEPWFGTGRVVLADSWFGSAACAIALFKYGLFSVMNVKTAHNRIHPTPTEMLLKGGRAEPPKTRCLGRLVANR